MPRSPKAATAKTSDIVRVIARIALFGNFDEPEIDGLLQSFNIPRLRSQMASLGICEADADDREIAQLYFSGRCRIISPNAFFDEAWYCDHYKDVAATIRTGGLVSGFVHFMKTGLHQGLWPNGVLHAEALACTNPGIPAEEADWTVYLASYPSVAAFLAAFPSLSPKDHYNHYGRFLGYSCGKNPLRVNDPLSLRVAEAEFDPKFYIRRYLTASSDAKYHADPFEHYVKFGMRAAHSPNAWFQEDWYRAFYKEVREGIENGWLPSGFYHYMLSGRMEGRLPKHDLALALEAKMPGVTSPALLGRSDMLRQRLEGLDILPTRSVSRRRRQTIWIFLPTLNPDIMYGGYRGVIALICALYRDGKNVTIVCSDSDPNRPYFLWAETSAQIRAVFAAIPILNIEAFSSETIGPSDFFVAYTVWDLIICEQLAHLTQNKLPLLLAQEFEPIFHDNGAQRALCEACYDIPHYPIINSNFLKTYFRTNKIGVFSGRASDRPFVDYAVFEHKINQLPAQSARSMRSRRHRVLAVYARPEAHAARNLFECVLIALQTLCERGAFGPEWRFIGLGALTKIPPIPLGGGHELKLTQKMSEEEYRKMCGELDIGISLMYAPHPSVVPFEFATTGAIVVTNTYENRTEAELQDICANIVTCRTSVVSLVAAITKAIAATENFAKREAQALHPRTQSWDEIFSPDFIDGVLNAASRKAAVNVVEAEPASTAPTSPQILAQVA